VATYAKSILQEASKIMYSNMRNCIILGRILYHTRSYFR